MSEQRCIVCDEKESMCLPPLVVCFRCRNSWKVQSALMELAEARAEVKERKRKQASDEMWDKMRAAGLVSVKTTHIGHRKTVTFETVDGKETTFDITGGK